MTSNTGRTTQPPKASFVPRHTVDSRLGGGGVVVVGGGCGGGTGTSAAGAGAGSVGLSTVGDANNRTVNFEPDSRANLQGMLVVWCGHLEQRSKFQGIILNLYGDGSAFPPKAAASSNCANDPTKGTYKNMGTDFSGWMYASGGTSDLAGIELGPNSRMGKYPGQSWSFLDSAFEATPLSSFTLVKGWLELYQ
jgi:hypothetical protein